MTDSDIIKIKCVFQNQKGHFSVGEEIKGTLHVTVTEAIEYTQFTANLKLEARGTMRTFSKSFPSVMIDGNSRLVPGEKYDFDFSLPATEIPSINGHNMDLVWYLVTNLSLTQESKSELRDRFVGEFKLLKWINPEKGLDAKYPFRIRQMKYGVQVQAASGVLKVFKRSILFYLAILVVIFLVIFFRVPVQQIITVLGGILALGVLLFYHFKRGKIKKLGKISYEITPDENKGFSCLLRTENQSTKVKSVEFRYNIIERVVDDRGTSTTTRTNTIFASQPEVANLDASNEIKAYLYFPDKPLLPTCFTGSASISWELEVVFHFVSGDHFEITQPIIATQNIQALLD